MDLSIAPQMISSHTAIALILAAAVADVQHFDVAIGDSSLSIAVQDPVSEKKAAELAAWVESTAETIRLVYGRFPVPEANAVIVPTGSGFWSSDDAVTFGQVTRNDGMTVTLYVNPDRPLHEFYSDWTATHEFSHLMLPLLDKQHRWISEGIATYYQNVLMARSSRYTPQRAWTKLLEGFARGRRSSPEMSPNAATAQFSRRSIMKIYWSGTAVALMADVEIRNQSDGEQSLDTVLDELQRCCLPAHGSWSGPKLFRKLDSFLETPVFMPLYKRYADQIEFPDTSSVLGNLGIVMRRGELQLQDNAALADLRTEIMAPD